MSATPGRLLHRSSTVALVVACVTLVVSAVGFQAAIRYYDLTLRKLPVELRDQLGTIARTLGGWRATPEDRVLPEAIVEELGTAVYLDRSYVPDDGGRRMDLHVDYYTGLIDAVPHVPDRCFVAGGLTLIGQSENHDVPLDTSTWSEDPELTNRATGNPYPMMRYRHRITGREVVVRMPVDPVRIRTSVYKVPGQSDVRVYAGYLFIANGRTTCVPERIRMLAFDRTDHHAYFCKLQFTRTANSSMTMDEFVGDVGSLLEPLLPELMRCLPDWSEVERRDDDGTEEEPGHEEEKTPVAAVTAPRAAFIPRG